MMASELEQEFPGLFAKIACETASEAESYADFVASRFGLGVRSARWIKHESARIIDYADPPGKLAFSVELVCEPHRGRRPFWTFRCSAERVDIGLRIESPRVRAQPPAFQRDAKEILKTLQSIHPRPDGSLLGCLVQWDRQKGKGLLECAPGAAVPLYLADIPSDERAGIRRLDRFSFQILKTGSSRRATNVHRQ